MWPSIPLAYGCYFPKYEQIEPVVITFVSSLPDVHINVSFDRPRRSIEKSYAMAPILSGDAYYVVYPERKAHLDFVKLFRDWVLRETRQARNSALT